MKLARYISVTCLKFKRFRTVDKLEYRCGLVEWFSIDNRGTLWDITLTQQWLLCLDRACQKCNAMYSLCEAKLTFCFGSICTVDLLRLHGEQVKESINSMRLDVLIHQQRISNVDFRGIFL